MSRSMQFFKQLLTQSKTKTPTAARSQMNTQEALSILNLKPKASKEEIISAHKRLMQKNHPDKGGSEHIASQINQAKEWLLKNHEH